MLGGVSSPAISPAVMRGADAVDSAQLSTTFGNWLRCTREMLAENQSEKDARPGIPKCEGS
jgi:hypothetical protein